MEWPRQPCLPAGSVTGSACCLCSSSWPPTHSEACAPQKQHFWAAPGQGVAVGWLYGSVSRSPSRAGEGQLFCTHTEQHLKGFGVD